MDAVYLCVSLVGCAAILFDFRVGVVLLIVLMPLSGSHMFPHAMLGNTGLNPLNLLLVGTLGSCLAHGLADGSIRRFLPLALLGLYLLPIVVAGARGGRPVVQVPPVFLVCTLVGFV